MSLHSSPPSPGDGSAKDQAQEAAGKAQEKAKEATGKAKGALRSQVDQRSTQAGEQITGTAGDVRSVGEQLREQGKEGPAKVADQAAERIERVGSYLRDSDGDSILGDVEGWGRRNPWALVAGGLFVGFAASRVLKASSSERYRSSENGGGSGPTSGPDYGAGVYGGIAESGYGASAPTESVPPVTPGPASSTPSTPPVTDVPPGGVGVTGAPGTSRP